MHGLAFWFDCSFPGTTAASAAATGGGGDGQPAAAAAAAVEQEAGQEAGGEIVLRTGPEHPPTHWNQTVVHLPAAATAALVGQPSLRCSVELAQDQQRPRLYNISVTVL